MTEPLILYGALASPYTMKVLAALRYRRIAHRFVSAYGPDIFTRVRALVIPVVQFANGDWANDSTPLLRRLEAEHPGRSVKPPRPAQAFLCDLLEDFADEWGTKLMFHYRWSPEADRAFNALSIVTDAARSTDKATLRRQASAFAVRQASRLPIVVGEANAAVLDATAAAIFTALDTLSPAFLFGSRPSAADFAWYGQMSQLIRDPTPRAWLERDYPFAVHWTRRLSDASGFEGEWAQENGAATPMIHLAARIHLPSSPPTPKLSTRAGRRPPWR